MTILPRMNSSWQKLLVLIRSRITTATVAAVTPSNSKSKQAVLRAYIKRNWASSTWCQFSLLVSASAFIAFSVKQTNQIDCETENNGTWNHYTDYRQQRKIPLCDFGDKIGHLLKSLLSFYSLLASPKIVFLDNDDKNNQVAVESNSSRRQQESSTKTAAPSWIRHVLYWCRVCDLPLPRVVRPGDPALRLSKSLLKQRQRDENKLKELQQKLENAVRSSPQIFQKKADDVKAEEFRQLVGSLATQQYEILYGPGVTPQDRMDFLARYGCTAWTSSVLQRLVELGDGRGFVEVGAGHGQWARAIEEEQRTRHQMQKIQQLQTQKNNAQMYESKQPRDFVLAYDDWSKLPLDPTVYHSKTKPHAAYFGNVHRIRQAENTHSDLASPMEVLLSQWKHRGRVLLLVYPTPELAAQSLQAYAGIGRENDTVVYVGEGRGGANAGDEFFDFLESTVQHNGDACTWVLLDSLPVRPFGTKGFERLFIFQKQSK